MDRVRECIVLGRKEKNRAHDGLLKQNPPRGPAPPQASAAPIGMQRVVGRGLRGPSTQSNSMEKKNRAPVALAWTRQTLAGVAVDPLESLSVRARTLGPAPPRLHPRGGRRAACTSAALWQRHGQERGGGHSQGKALRGRSEQLASAITGPPTATPQ